MKSQNHRPFDDALQRSNSPRRSIYSLRHHIRTTVFVAGLALFVSTFQVSLVLAVDVERVLWGFDGRVVRNRFNPVSVLLSNPSPNPFEGDLRLKRAFGNGQNVGATITQPVFVSPFSSRWVQLYPYVKTGYEEWQLDLGRGTPRIKLNRPRIEEPAPVLLTDPDNFIGRGGALKRFPENLMPPMVTATDGLKIVVLDHVPRWEGIRRQAFLDWLHRGGHVHLLHSESGSFPEFTAQLSALNAPLDQFHVGAGWVFRHPQSRTRVTRTFVNNVILKKSLAVERPETGDALAELTAAKKKQANANNVYGNNGQWFQDLSAALFGNLKQMTRPDHSWGLIYFMSFVYILMIFPGIYILGRKRFDYRMIYVVLLVTVVVFSLGFSVVGRRGYGESTTVNSIAIAHALPDGSLDVTGWSNVFVTRGDDYNITFNGNGMLFSTCQDNEVVNGSIQNGAKGSFLVDIPPFSSRPFTHRVRFQGKPIKIAVSKWSAAESLQQLELTVGENFPASTTGTLIYAVHGKSLYPMLRSGGKLTAQVAGPVGIESFFNGIDFNRFASYQWYNQWNEEESTNEEQFLAMYRPMIARNLNLQTRKEMTTFSLPPGRIRLFVFSKMPAEFFIQDDRLGKQLGYVVYNFDLIQPMAQ